MTEEMQNSAVAHIRSLCEEVRSLRRANEKMSDRLGMFDDFMCILHGTPGQKQQQGATIDELWQAEQFLSRLKG